MWPFKKIRELRKRVEALECYAEAIYNYLNGQQKELTQFKNNAAILLKSVDDETSRNFVTTMLILQKAVGLNADELLRLFEIAQKNVEKADEIVGLNNLWDASK